MRIVNRVLTAGKWAMAGGVGFLTFVFAGTALSQTYTMTVGQGVPQGYQQPNYGQQAYTNNRRSVSIRHQHKYQQPTYAYQSQQPTYSQPRYAEPSYNTQKPVKQRRITTAPKQQKVKTQKRIQVARAAASTSNYTLPRKYQRQMVDYHGKHKPGTIIVNTKERLLYHVRPGNKAMRYGIGVARPGFEWSGFHKVTRKKKWPSWTPPAAMRKREPHLPKFMPGGPKNPMGARALYLGSTLYRIHGSNAPWTIGQNVSSGCIRMTNDDVTHLYTKVGVGARVYVI